MRLPEAGKRVVENRRLKPDLDALRKECGAQVTVNADGTCSGKIEGKENLRRYVEMSTPWRKAEIERSAEQAAAVPAVTLRDAAGNPVVVPERQAEVTARRRRLRSRLGRYSERTTYHADGTVSVHRR